MIALTFEMKDVQREEDCRRIFGLLCAQNVELNKLPKTNRTNGLRAKLREDAQFLLDRLDSKFNVENINQARLF